MHFVSWYSNSVLKLLSSLLRLIDGLFFREFNRKRHLELHVLFKHTQVPSYGTYFLLPVLIQTITYYMVGECLKGRLFVDSSLLLIVFSGAVIRLLLFTRST